MRQLVVSQISTGVIIEEIKLCSGFYNVRHITWKN